VVVLGVKQDHRVEIRYDAFFVCSRFGSVAWRCRRYVRHGALAALFVKLFPRIGGVFPPGHST